MHKLELVSRSEGEITYQMESPVVVAPKSNKGPRRPRSVVWNYFEKVDYQQARCNICGVTCNHANNTSNLFKHLSVKHPATYKEAEDQREAEMELYCELRAKSGRPVTRPIIKRKIIEPKVKRKVGRPRKHPIDESMADDSTPAGFKSPKRPRSVVWYYFDKIDLQRAECKICGTTCLHANNTSNLFQHLRIKHPTNFTEAENRQEAEMEQYLDMKAKSGQSIGRSGIRGRRPKIFGSEDGFDTPVGMLKKTMRSRQNITQSILRLIAVDLHQPSLIKGKGFREFLRSMDPWYELPTKSTIEKTLLPELTEETKNKVKLEVGAATNFALSVDTWTYKDMHCFVTLSAHFIRDTWKMSSIVLETFDCTEDKTETNIATNLKRISDEWGLSDHIIAIIANADDSLAHSASIINGWDPLMCFGHTMNTVINGALTSVAELVRIQKKTSDAVAYFEKSIKASDTLTAVQHQHNLPVHRLKQENPRYWTSTYIMLSRMVEQYEAVNTVLCFLGMDHMCLCDDEVELIRSVIDVLKPFEAATKELCSESYTSMSKVIPIATLLQQVTSAGIATQPGPQSALKNALITQMQQHFVQLENSYKLAVSTLLDPRFKSHAFTDSTALETAQQRLNAEVASIISSSETNHVANNTSTTDTSTASFWNMFDQKVSEAGAMKTSSSEADNECRRFFKEANIPRNASPLSWWKLNEELFPHLKVLAQKYLCIPATASDSNRLFTKEGDVVAQRRDMIKPANVHAMIFLNKNLA